MACESLGCAGKSACGCGGCGTPSLGASDMASAGIGTGLDMFGAYFGVPPQITSQAKGYVEKEADLFTPQNPESDRLFQTAVSNWAQIQSRSLYSSAAPEDEKAAAADAFKAWTAFSHDWLSGLKKTDRLPAMAKQSEELLNTIVARESSQSQASAPKGPRLQFPEKMVKKAQRKRRAKDVASGVGGGVVLVGAGLLLKRILF